MGQPLTLDEAQVLEELRKCKASFPYFCRKYLRILSEGRIIPFVLNRAQRRLVMTFAKKSRHIYIIKARQLGSSTVIAALYFWLMMFNKDFHVALVAHTDRGAIKILKIYRRYYQHLPKWMQDLVPLALTEDAAHCMAFHPDHGSRVESYTAGSETISGSTYQALHLSEFPKWVGDVQASLNSALMVASEEATVIFEGTAKGANHGYTWWNAKNGYYKLFLSWLDDSRCVKDDPPEDGIPPGIAMLGDQYQMTPEQINWAADKFFRKSGANIKNFNQELPCDVGLAFILSGDRFFDFIFWRLSKKEQVAADKVGREEYINPGNVQYTPCVIGIDTAGGSDEGSYCSWTVLAAEDKRAPKTASCFYQRGIKPIAFAKLCLAEAKLYGAFAVMEVNYHGETVLEHFQEEGYHQIYIRKDVDSTTKSVVQKWGWQTDGTSRPRLLNKLYEYIQRGWLKIVDARMKKEMNTFVYDKTGKAVADEGMADDMIFSHALAVQGLAQIQVVEERILQTQPTSMQQILQWEEQTGIDYDEWDFAGDTTADDEFDAAMFMAGGE